ncbi:MAG: glycosyltransferase family 39 protein [Armatimonadota bacterium]
MKRIKIFLFIGIVVEILIIALFYLNKSVEYAGGIGFPLDDSWIHSHLARNWAEGNGMVYNIGHPVSSTTILYTLLLGIAFKIAVSPVIDSIILGLCLHVAASYVIYLIARRLAASDFVSILAALLFAATPRLIWGAIGGMEVPLYVFLVTLGIYHHLLYRWDDTPRAYLSTVWFGLSTLARPECGMFVVLALIDRGISALRSHNLLRYIKTVPLHILIAVLPVIPWAIFNWSYSGHLMPPSFYAKVTTGGLPLPARVIVLGIYLHQAADICLLDNALLAICAIIGMVICILKALSSKSDVGFLLPLAFLGLPTAVGQISPILESGDQLIVQIGRYSAYLVPLFILMGAVGIDAVLKLMSRYSRFLRRAIVIAVVILGFGLSVSNNYALAAVYARQVQNINDMQASIGKWAVTLPPGTVMACNDVGAIAYYSRKTVIDTVGVINPEVIPYINKNTSDAIQDGLWKYLSKRKPAYLIIFPDWYPKISKRPELQFVRSYYLKNNIICGGQVMVVYKVHWK